MFKHKVLHLRQTSCFGEQSRVVPLLFTVPSDPRGRARTGRTHMDPQQLLLCGGLDGGPPQPPEGGARVQAAAFRLTAARLLKA